MRPMPLSISAFIRLSQTWLRGSLQDEGIQLFGAPPSRRNARNDHYPVSDLNFHTTPVPECSCPTYKDSWHDIRSKLKQLKAKAKR